MKTLYENYIQSLVHKRNLEEAIVKILNDHVVFSKIDLSYGCGDLAVWCEKKQFGNLNKEQILDMLNRLYFICGYSGIKFKATINDIYGSLGNANYFLTKENTWCYGDWTQPKFFGTCPTTSSEVNKQLDNKED